MGPIRELPPDKISGPRQLRADQIRPVNLGDLQAALQRTKPSVGRAQLAELEAWNDEFGSG
jgi:hypothetical protein